MSDLIWKVKQLFRKFVPLALILGLCFGGFYAYKKGWLGRNISQKIAGLSQRIPLFGSKFLSKPLALIQGRGSISASPVYHATHSGGHRVTGSHRSRRGKSRRARRNRRTHRTHWRHHHA